MITRGASLIDVAFLVATELERASITAVLTGGCAAAFYAPNEYESHDADFVIAFRTAEEIDAIMHRLDFERRGRMFVHPNSPYTVEFPTGPLGIGSDLVRTWERVTRAELSMNVISRTDSVRDRLCGFYFWNEIQSLKVALSVARSGPVDLDLIRDWSERERSMEKFNEFLDVLQRQAQR